MSRGFPSAGELVWHYGTKPPWGTLPCDGASYLMSEYPELWAQLSDEWHVGPPGATYQYFKVDATHFKTPDLRDRVVICLGPVHINPVEQGGAETHTLITAEMPAHVHTEIAAVSGTQSYQGGTNRAAPVFTTPNTGSAGGGGAHNNMQPYGVARVAIRYI